MISLAFEPSEQNRTPKTSKDPITARLPDPGQFWLVRSSRTSRVSIGVKLQSAGPTKSACPAL